MPENKHVYESSGPDDFTVRDVVASYELAAKRLVPRYEKLTFENVFEGLIIQQSVLKRDQQLAEWSPC